MLFRNYLKILGGFYYFSGFSDPSKYPFLTISPLKITLKSQNFSPAALFRPVYTLKIFGALRAPSLQFTLVKRRFWTPKSSKFSPAAAKIQEISPNFENLGGFLLLLRNYPKFFGGFLLRGGFISNTPVYKKIVRISGTF